MGDISIIARRLADGHVQYGWSGNGGYYRSVGLRLLMWYQKPENVEYLFELGQTRLIGKPGSEKGGGNWFETHGLTGEAFWLGRTERSIFSKIMFIDYGYFYDLDYKWYYFKPGPFRIKIPLELIENNLDDEGYEFNYIRNVEKEIAKFIFNEYMMQDIAFAKFLCEEGYNAQQVLEDITGKDRRALYVLYDKYRKIHDYFDDWILVKANSNYTKIDQIIMRKKENAHIETCEW